MVKWNLARRINIHLCEVFVRLDFIIQKYEFFFIKVKNINKISLYKRQLINNRHSDNSIYTKIPR